MSRIAIVFAAFGKALSCLRRGRTAVPLLAYFLLQLLLLGLYAWSGPRAAVFWALLRPGMDPEVIRHYPEHLLYVGSILGRFDIPLEILVLVLAQGATVLLVASAAGGTPAGVGASLAAAGRRYLHLIVASAAAAVAMIAGLRLPMSLIGRRPGIPDGIGLATGVLACVVLQAFILYAIPFILIERRPALDALRRSFGFAGRHFVESFLLVLVPFLLTVPMLLLDLNARSIALQISPEFLIHVQVAGEAVQLVATYLLVGGLTVFFIETRKAENTR
jgi:hypothetical protein